MSAASASTGWHARVLKGRQSVARKTADKIAKQVDEGTILICNDDEPAAVFLQEEIIRTVASQERVEASGQPVELHGYMVVPIKPEGAVQLDLFDIAEEPTKEPSEMPAGERKVYARESVGSLGISIIGHPPEQVFIESVTDGGWAESQGLAIDDEVLAINDTAVEQLTDTRFIQQLRARPCVMTIRERGALAAGRGAAADTKASEEQTKGKQQRANLGRKLAAAAMIRKPARQKANKDGDASTPSKVSESDAAPNCKVTIISARIEMHGDAIVCQDLTVTGDVMGKAATEFTTGTVSDTLNPVWNHDVMLSDVGEKDSLRMQLMAGGKLVAKRKAKLTQLTAPDFSGEIELTSFVAGVQVALSLSIQLTLPNEVLMSPQKEEQAVDAPRGKGPVEALGALLEISPEDAGKVKAQIATLEARLEEVLAEVLALRAERDKMQVALAWHEDKGAPREQQEASVQAMAEAIDGKRWSNLSWIEKDGQPKEGEQAVGDENATGVVYKDSTKKPGATTMVFTAEEDVEVLGLLTDGQPPGPLIATTVTRGGWAKEVGIQPQDEILEINDAKIADLTMDEIKTSMSARPLKLLVSGAPEVTEEEQIVALANEEDTILGVTFVPMPPEPVFAKKVRADSWAHKAGMIPGSEILSVNEQDVEQLTKTNFLELLRQRPLTMKFILPVKAWGKFEEAPAPKDPKEEELEKREAQLHRRERELRSVMETREEEVIKREEDLNPHEERLYQQDQELQGMEERLKELEKELNRRDGQLNKDELKLEEESNQRGQELDQREAELEEREQKVQDLQEEFEPREDELKQREEDLNGMGEKLRKRKQKLNERENELDEREHELQDFKQELKDFETELKEREAACGLAEEVARKAEEERVFKEAMVEATATGDKEEEEEEEDLLGGQIEWILEAKASVKQLGFTPERLPHESWAYVRKVVVGRWADEQGMKDGDLLIAIDGKDLADIESNAKLLKALEKRPLKLTLFREEEKIEKPKDKAFDCVADYEDKPLGFTPLTFPPGRVFVEQVSSSGWAARTGIQRGAEIILVNGERASKLSADDFRSHMRIRPLQLRIKPITTYQVEPDEQLEKLSLDDVSRPLGLVFAVMLPWKFAIAEVLEKSWAEQAGMEKDMEITHVNGRDIVEMTILDLKRVLRVQPISFKLELPMASSIRELTADKVDIDLGCHIKYDDDLGLTTSDGSVISVFIDEIYKGHWAHKKGIKAGSEILAVNGKEVSTMTPQHLQDMVEQIRPLRIKVSPPVGRGTRFEYAPHKLHFKHLHNMKKATKKSAGDTLTKRRASSEDAKDQTVGAEDTDSSDSDSHVSASDDTDEDTGMMRQPRSKPPKGDEWSENEEEERRQPEEVPSVEIQLKVEPHPDIIRRRAQQEEEAYKKELQSYLDRIRESEEYIFQHLDEDKLGSVSYEEFRRGLHVLNVHLNDEAFDRLMEELDPYKTGHVPYEGFHTRVGIHRWEHGGGLGGQGDISEEQQELNEELRREEEQEKAAMKAFKKADYDESGKLSYDELRELHKDLNDTEFADMMEKIDMDGDGLISMNEYLNRHLAIQEAEFQKRLEDVQSQFREREAEQFRSQDVDGSGKLTYEEVRMQRPDLSDEEFKAMWKQLDEDDNGFITKAEWIVYQDEQLDKEQAAQEAEVLKTFKDMDKDHSGKLTELEIRGMHLDLSDREFQRMMRKLDRDGDGNVSREEYLKVTELERKQQLLDKRDEDLKNQELAFFRLGDMDHSGRITFEELKEIHPEMTEQQLMKLWRRIDKDMDGTVSKEEWLGQFRLSDEERKHKKVLEDLMQEVEVRETELFNRIDVDGSGKLALDDLHQGLYPLMSSEEFKEIVEKERMNKESKPFVTLPEYIARYHDLDLEEKEPLLNRLEQLNYIEGEHFMTFDLDESSRLSLREMHGMYSDKTDGEFAEMIRKFDREGDGLITAQEYLCRHVVDETTMEERLLSAYKCCITAELKKKEADLKEYEVELKQREDEVALLFTELRTQFMTRSDAADKRDEEFEEYARTREEEMWVKEQLQREQLDSELLKCKDREKAVTQREEEVFKFMSDIFQNFDTDDSGSLTHNEFKKALTRMGWEVSGHELFAMMRQLDEDGDGTINYREFIKLFALMRSEQEKHEGQKTEQDEDERGYHDSRIVSQEWQRQEHYLRQLDEAKLRLEQQRKKNEYERRVHSAAEPVSTVLRLAMEHFVLLGAAVASLANGLEKDLHYKLLQLVLQHAGPCETYHSGITGLCSDLQKRCEELDMQQSINPEGSKSPGTKPMRRLMRHKPGLYELHVGDEVEDFGFKLRGQPPEQVIVAEVYVGGWAEAQGIRAADELVAINGVETVHMTLEQYSQYMTGRPCTWIIRVGTSIETSKSARTATDAKAMQTKMPATEELIGNGTALRCIADGVAEIFKSPHSHEITGFVSFREQVEASGHAVEVDGCVFVPIKPHGVVQRHLFDIIAAQEASDSQKKLASPPDNKTSQSQQKLAEVGVTKESTKRIMAKVKKGTKLTCTDDDGADVFAEPLSPKILGVFFYGEHVEASGKCIEAHGDVFVPIKPEGVVRLDLFGIYGAHEASEPESPTSAHTSHPHLRMPDVHMPDLHMPDVHMPDVHMPQVHMPQVHIPQVHMPHVHMPQVHMPQFHMPTILSKEKGEASVESEDHTPSQALDVVGTISASQEVRGSDRPLEKDGDVFVPIKPEGVRAPEELDTTESKIGVGWQSAEDEAEALVKRVSATQETAKPLSRTSPSDPPEELEPSATTVSDRPRRSARRSEARASAAQREVAVDSIYTTKRTAVDINGGAFAAVLSNGSVVAWGHQAEGGDCSYVAEELAHGVRRIYSTAHAFAALKQDGSVVAWGNAVDGGEPGAARQFILSQVQVVYSTDSAFAALTSSGAVYTWGNARSGGDSSTVTDQLRGGVKSVSSTSQAFAALKLDGSVCTWGHPQFGGDSIDLAEDLEMNVSRVYSTTSAFAAVKFFGSVHTWGSATGGADMSFVQEKLSNQVQQVFSTVNSFAALKRDGSVVTWGHPEFGGKSEDVTDRLRGVKRIYATDGAFAALRKGGAVITWGARPYGGDSSAVRTHLLKGVEGIYSTSRAFAAIKADGAVFTWGAEQAGGDSSSLHRELQKGVRQVYSTTLAFAVVKTSGRVFSWGSATAGGDSTAVQEHLASGVQRIYATAQAFAAVLQDGTVQTWGNPDFGGDSSAVRDHLQRILRIAQPKRLRQPGARGSIVRRSSLLPGSTQHSMRVGASALEYETWAGEPARASLKGAERHAVQAADERGKIAGGETESEFVNIRTESVEDRQDWQDKGAVSEAPGEIAGADTEAEPPNIIY